MSALDSLLGVAGDAPTLPGFMYDVIPSSSAIVDRKNGKVQYPTSATTLTPTGTRTARIVVGGDAFCDSSSVRLMFTINNLDTAKDLKFWSGPWGAWSTVRLLSQGREIERLELYGRHHELFGFQLLPFNDQWTEAAVTGLHGSFDATLGQLQPLVGKIEKGERAIVMHKLHLSLFESKKILPLRFCPLEIEVSLAPAGYWVDSQTASGGVPTYSQNYSISDLRVIYDEVVPDDSIVSSFYSGLLKNQIMSIPCLTAFQWQQTIASGATSVDVVSSRAFSKISSVWVTFSGSYNILNSDLLQPSAPPNGLGTTPFVDSGSPPWAPSVQLSIGGKNYPDPAPADSIPMQYYNLIKALGYSPNVTRDDFINDTYVLVTDMKRVPFDHGTGISSRSGDQIRVSIKNLTANRATTVHVTMFAYTIVAIRENGVEKLD